MMIHSVEEIWISGHGGCQRMTFTVAPRCDEASGHAMSDYGRIRKHGPAWPGVRDALYDQNEVPEGDLLRE